MTSIIGDLRPRPTTFLNGMITNAISKQARFPIRKALALLWKATALFAGELQILKRQRRVKLGLSSDSPPGSPTTSLLTRTDC